MKTKGTLLLLSSALIWGFSLVAQKTSLDYIGTFSFTAIRTLIGGVLLIPIVMKISRSPLTKDEIKGGFLCGTFLAAAIIVQQYGLAYTSIGKAAFLTALYILETPLIGLLFRKKCGRNVWIAIFIAITGLYMMCLYGGKESLNLGDMLQLASSILYAIQVRLVDQYANDMEPVRLSCIMLLTTGALSGIGALFIDQDITTIANIMDCILPILYGGILSCFLAYTFQIVGQKYIDVNIAALLMSTETVFSLIAGMLFFHEILTIPEYIGCLLMSVAIVIAQVPDRPSR